MICTECNSIGVWRDIVKPKTILHKNVTTTCVYYRKYVLTRETIFLIVLNYLRKFCFYFNGFGLCNKAYSILENTGYNTRTYKKIILKFLDTVELDTLEKGSGR